ncbi:hypothetical protein UFOVP813_30 [uncultured Caudovirales phage]|uniref:Uncharacterized protein n=1 Tax=uncultured Caudovirales phage TaxID=2100421 RepID=A0A6J5P7N9_9CAUD|nr:hypothetical protein UFOVP813_30 [uncultured Caudovirales phage]
MRLYPRFLLEGEGGQGGGGGGAPPAFTPSYEGALGNDGAFSEGWTAKAFGPDYKGPLAGVKSFGDVNKIITDSMTAARAKTEGMVKVPGVDAKPEEIAAYHKALGVPDKPEDYAYTLPEGIKEENISKEQMDGWRKALRDAGIPKAAAERLLNKHLADTATQLKARADEYAAGIAAERVAMATRFPEIDKTVALAKSLANRAGVPESLKNAIAAGAFDPTNDKGFWGADALESFAWAAKASGEDSGGGQGGGGSGGGTLTVAQAKDVVTNKLNPEYAEYHKGNPAILAKVSAGYASGK